MLEVDSIILLWGEYVMGCEDGVVARWWDAFGNRMELNIVIIITAGVSNCQQDYLGHIVAVTFHIGLQNQVVYSLFTFSVFKRPCLPLPWPWQGRAREH
jgi:hypothetical protein